MNKKGIEKKIKRYTISKFTILGTLVISIIFMIISAMIYKNEIVAISSYLVMILSVVAAYVFSSNKALSKPFAMKDYIGILEYLSKVSEDMGNEIYFDSLFLIKNSLNEIAHYQMDKKDDYIKRNVYYLQSLFFSTDKERIIPFKLYDRMYVSSVCKELLCQIDKHDFDTVNLVNIRYSGKSKRKRKIHVSAQNICIFCTLLLGCVVLYKVMVTLNGNWYHESLLERLVYNTSADIIAIIFAITTYFKKDR